MDITPVVEKFFGDNAGKNFCLPCVRQLNEIRDYNDRTALELLWKNAWAKEVQVGVCSECRMVEHVRKRYIRAT